MNQFLYLTGDLQNSQQVTQYGPDGSSKDLAGLNTGRFDHGCAGYYKEQDNFVLLVVGGVGFDRGETESHFYSFNSCITFDPETLSSTEVFEVGSSLVWETISPLPNELSLKGLRAASVDNQIYLTGEENFPRIDH